MNRKTTPGARLQALAIVCIVGLLAGCSTRESAHRTRTTPDDPPPPTLTGLDRIDRGLVPLPEGRLGLVVHSASVTLTGDHAVDVFGRLGAPILRLFSPEHGLRGQAAAGELVSSRVDPDTGLEVSSLYGETRKPSHEDLSDLETLVFDLQGGGVRFYTYVSTLLLCLEAAAENDVHLVILDRPNPLGGELVAGPVSAGRQAVPESFLNMAPGPLVHGLTLGEVARFANHQRALAGSKTARLEVVMMSNWSRSMTWPATRRPFISPSPNLRSPTASSLYPGTALFEGTNVSEGRGTERPFVNIGAPWFDDSLVASLTALEIPGVEMRPTRFVPTASPAAPEPKYLDEMCLGIELAPTGSFDPFNLGVELLVTVAQHPSFELRADGDALTRLLGNPRLSEILAGPQPRSAAETWLEELELTHHGWRAERAPYLLYASAVSRSDSAR